jgi:4-hydroxy-tetrahydrodipicolinate synthase
MFEGVYVAVVTPFAKSGEVDVDALRAHVDWLIREGVHGLVPAGTCGEYASLSDGERAAVVEAVLAEAQGRVPVVVGVAATTTAQVVRWAQHARDHGAQAVMALPPIQYRPTWAEVVAHYRAIDAVGLPIVIYNNPFDTSTDVTAERVRELEQVARIAAVKEFSGDVRRVTELIQTCRASVLAGADDLVLESMFAGAVGWIAGMANIVPAASVALYEAARARDYDRAWALYRRMLPLLRYDTTPRLVQAIKYGLSAVGRPVGDTRPPRLPLEEADRRRIDAVLADLASLAPTA